MNFTKNRLVALFFLVALLAVIPCSGQVTGFTIGVPPHPGSINLFADLCGLGDVNQDGFDDFAFSDANPSSSSPILGFVYVHSGLDGTLLYSITGSSLGSFFGASIAMADDYDNDGIKDFLVGSPGADTINGINSGLVSIRSGHDGTEIGQIMGDQFNRHLGSKVASGADVNGDGILDIIVGLPTSSLNPNSAGKVRVFSGANLSIILALDGTTAGSFFGFDVDGLGDLDGDGFDEVIVGAPLDSPNGPESGSIAVFSGATGLPIFQVDGATAYHQFGFSVANAKDINRDGIPDFITGSPFQWPTGGLSLNSATHAKGVARVYSGSDGALLFNFIGQTNYDQLGSDVSAAGDFNGDGFNDLAVGAPGRDPTNPNSRRHVAVYSGLDGTRLAYFGGSGGYGSLALGGKVDFVGDTNGDGFADILSGYRTAVGIRAYTNFPVLHYFSEQGSTDLDLSWHPDNGFNLSPVGTLTCTGGAAGGFGLFGVSLAGADIALVFGFPLLIANDSTNLLALGTFGFDANGEILINNVSRQNPFLAGSQLYLQFFQSFPSFASSNGVRLDVVAY